MAKTYLGFVLDESTSMRRVREATISSFNEYIDDLRDGVEGELLMTLVKFNSTAETIYETRPINEVPELTEATYVPSGNTALYDGINHAISTIEKQMKRGDRALIVISTDGEENSSREIRTREQMQGIIQRLEGKGNWTFVYLGADQDAWAVGQSFGISSAANTVSHANTPVARRSAMRSLATSTLNYTADSALASSNFFANSGEEDVSAQTSGAKTPTSDSSVGK